MATDFDVDQFAYIPVSIWCAPGEDELQLPLPTDLLSQQVQCTAQLVGNAFWSAPIPGFASDVIPPAAFDTAYFQIEQLCMRDRGMGLANRVDMNTHAYTMPLPTFDQQEVLLQMTSSTASPQQIVLTGFRAGQVKKLQVYLTKNVAAGPVADPNALLWYAPTAIKVLYAGLVYASYLNGSSAMWNLLDGTAPSAVNQSQLAIAGGVWTSTPALSSWVELPFGQPSGSDYASDISVAGKEITNGIVNLEVTPPPGGDPVLGWTLHVVYVYNANLVFARGTAELSF